MNLKNPDHRKQLAERIKNEINDYSEKLYGNSHRAHLGASIIGEVCNRKKWYIFRWVKVTDFDGRMLRLFNRGDREEALLVSYLRGIGFNISDETKDGKQHRIDGENHFGGSLDGIGKFPLSYDLNNPLLFEFKTAKASSFKNLVKKGVVKSKPTHFAQMNTYGFKRDLDYCLYYCVNKDDDDFYIEIVKLDHVAGENKTLNAKEIIESPTPPEKFSLHASHKECNNCDFKNLCHYPTEETAEVNCRSCKFAIPVDDREWFCDKYSQIIPKNNIKMGCQAWESCNVHT